MSDAARENRQPAKKYTIDQLKKMEVYQLRLAYADVFGWDRRSESMKMGAEELISAILGGEDQ